MRVRQVDHVLDLLEVFAERLRPATLAEISGHFGWPRSSTYNILSTLAARGYLYEASARGHFYPTARWFGSAEAILSADPVPEALRRIVADLAAETGETVTVAVPGGEHAIRIGVAVSPAPIRYNAEIGSRLPIHVTGSGHALLSLFPVERQTSLLRRAVFTRYGAGSPAGVADVERAIADGLRRGWFESRSNFSVDLGGVSVPLRLNERMFALTVAGPLFRVEHRMAEHARAIHRAIGRHLGPGHLAEVAPELGSPGAE